VSGPRRRQRRPHRLGSGEPLVTVELRLSEARLAAGALAVIPREPNRETLANTTESARRKLRAAIDEAERTPSPTQGELADRLRRAAM
jgi:hypothetical protein